MTAALSILRSAGPMHPKALTGFFQQVPALRELPARALEALAARVEVRRHRRGAVLWTRGQAADEVGWVRSGVVRVDLPVEGDREVTAEYLGRGELIGLEAAPERDEEASAHEELTLLVLSRAGLESWLAEHPAAARALMVAAADHGRRARRRLALVTMNGARARLAALLLELGERFGVRDSEGLIIDLRLTHRELAALIGATRETVSVAIVELRQASVLRTEHRRVVVLQEQALRALVV